MNKYKEKVLTTGHLADLQPFSGGGDELITLSHKDVKKSYIRANGVYLAIVDEPDIFMSINSDGGSYGIADGLTGRIKDYSFDTYVEHFLKTFPFLDKVAPILIERLTQEPGYSEAPEDEKILTFLQSIAWFLRFTTVDMPSHEGSITVCSSDLFDILFKNTEGGFTETEETHEFVFLAPKCHNLRDAFYFFTNLQG